ncbi:hypothetical protein [Parachitinimonas caeni]|uniref:Polar amino acid transport system substrate-binding protein n=1 Tax=Parachitinimonas caeni TaxID=3031301 RepID=A0ABT7DV23_9NEIS|nr:hypothetical protein [Parachitinimonas caeni]MDK2123920.1 hypothetical protein [Parachitinimonas caeni]
MRKWILTLVALTSAMLQSVAAETVRLCYDEEEVYPWRMTGKVGLDFVQLKQLERLTAVRLELEPLPWKRCQHELKENRWDGAVAASFRPERLEMGVYPMKDGKPDNNLRMRTESYSLFRLVGTTPSWDGKEFSGISGPIGAQLGYSVVEMLTSAKLQVDSGTRSADDNLRKLLAKRVVAVALTTQEGEQSIEARNEFRGRIERVNPPLTEKAYFLIFSKDFYARNETLAKQLWNQLPAARESEDYKRAFAMFRQN